MRTTPPQPGTDHPPDTDHPPGTDDRPDTDQPSDAPSPPAATDTAAGTDTPAAGAPGPDDQPRAAAAGVTVTVYPDGPLLLRGHFELRTADGALLDPGRAVVALCRCGRSALKPLCDGTHRLARWSDGDADGPPCGPAR